MSCLRSYAIFFHPEDSVFSCDIQNAFHHIMVLLEDQPYLGFCWEHLCYKFRVLPFGLAPSPLVFSKVVGVLVKHWRSKGIHVHAYLDDFLAGGFTDGSVHTPGHAVAVRLQILKDLTNAGFLLSAKKAQLTLVRSIRHLGMIVDFKEKVFTPPYDKFEALRSLCQETLDGPTRIPVRSLARVAGMIQSLRIGLGPVVSFYTRNMYYCIDSAPYWSSFVDRHGRCA